MQGKAFMSTMATFTTYKRDNLPHLLRYEKKNYKILFTYKIQRLILIGGSPIEAHLSDLFDQLSFFLQILEDLIKLQIWTINLTCDF